MGIRSRGGRAGKATVLVAAGVMLAGCQNGSGTVANAPPEMVPGGITSTVQVVFDSASAAFLAGDVALARDLFSAVLEEDSTFAAAWVGLSLAEQATGSVWSADSALGRARDLIEPPRRPRPRGQPNPAT